MNTEIPIHLPQAIKEKNCILFAGAGFSREATLPTGDKLPTGSETAYRLAQELYAEGYFPDEPQKDQPYNLADIAEDYETAFTRYQLIKRLEETFAPEGLRIGEAHRLAIKHFPIIATTNYDFLFEDAIRETGQRPKVVVRENQRPLESTTMIVKLHGDLENPERIVITSEDYYREPIPELLRNWLKDKLAEKVFAFVGYGLADSNFQNIYFQVSERTGKLKPPSFVVTPPPIEESPHRKRWELYRQRWTQRGMIFIPGTAGGFMQSLDAALSEPIVEESNERN